MSEKNLVSPLQIDEITSIAQFSLRIGNTLKISYLPFFRFNKSNTLKLTTNFILTGNSNLFNFSAP